MAVDAVIKTSALRKSCDNITAVLIAFDNFENLLTSYQDGGVNIKEEMIEEILLEPIPEEEENIIPNGDIPVDGSSSHIESNKIEEGKKENN